MISPSDVEFEKKAKDMLQRVIEWATKHMLGKEVAGGCLRRKLAAMSFSLSMDFISGINILTNFGQRSSAAALHRSVIESYLRGFWLAYVADEDSIQKFSTGKLTKTAKPLATAIKKKGLQDKCKMLSAERILNHLDELTHGGIHHMALRDIGNERATINQVASNAQLLVLCATYLVFLIEISYLVAFEDAKLAEDAYEEGRMLLSL